VQFLRHFRGQLSRSPARERSACSPSCGPLWGSYTTLAANALTGFAPRSFTLEDGPASGEEALALAGLLGGAVGRLEPFASLESSPMFGLTERMASTSWCPLPSQRQKATD